MTREELLNKIDEKVNEIFYDYQTSEGIAYGDISPTNAFALDELEEKLADLVIYSMEGNR